MGLTLTVVDISCELMSRAHWACLCDLSGQVEVSSDVDVELTGAIALLM